MKKIIRSTNDLLLAVLMSGLSIFLLLSKKIITGVENGLGGMWAQASTYIHLLAGALTGCGSTGSSSARLCKRKPGQGYRRLHRLQQRKLRHHHGAAQGHGHLRQGYDRSV